jgi:hypothetical protein
MAKPEKAYILRIDTPVSKEYAQVAADSCDKVGLPWEYFEGINFKETGKNDFWSKVKRDTGIAFKQLPSPKNAGGAATAGHIMIWNKIAKNCETAIILEHDAIMLRNVEIDIPDNTMIMLGYKVKDIQNYKHENLKDVKQEILPRRYHGGAHAYAINAVTASQLIENVINRPQMGLIDNHFFISDKGRGSSIKMGIIDPTPAIGWLRESTIWGRSAVDNYGPILKSFKENYNSKENLGIKNKK